MMATCGVALVFASTVFVTWFGVFWFSNQVKLKLETLADLRRYAEPIVLQTVQNRAMPLGNQTGMTDEERDMLGRWLNATR